MKELFYPKSIALIGASENPDKIGNQILKNILLNGYKGYVYPVNLDANKIEGLKSYKSVDLIPSKIDLVIICIPREYVLEEIKKSVKKNIKNLIIISAGFKEQDKTGVTLEKEILNISKKYKLNIIGPNSLGFYNLDYSLNASFGYNYKKSGDISVISQSGAIITTLINYAVPYEFGFNKVISIGNKTVLNENDYLEFLIKENKTNKFVLYLESFSNAKKLSELISQNKNKKFFILFGGETVFGKQASKSHTGNLLPNSLVERKMVEKSGAIFLDNVEEFFNAILIKNFIIPKKIKIITNAGGLAITLIDDIDQYGLKPEIEMADVLGDANETDYEKAIIGSEKDVDLIIAIVSPQTNTDYDKIAQKILISSKKIKKQVLVSFLNVDKYIKYFMRFYKSGILPYYYPEKYFQTISKIRLERSERSHYKIKTSRKSKKQISTFLNSNENIHLKPFLIFKELGLSALDTYICDNYAKVSKTANQIGYPIVLKTASENIIHKKQSGGIYINICNQEQLKDSYIKLSKILKDVLIQPMKIFGEEIILGAKKDDKENISFVFGKGGSYVEKIHDTALTCPPIELNDFEEFKKNTKIGHILTDEINYKLLNIYQKLQYLLENFDIQEIDLNPIKIDPETGEVLIIDARIL